MVHRRRRQPIPLQPVRSSFGPKPSFVRLPSTISPVISHLRRSTTTGTLHVSVVESSRCATLLPARTAIDSNSDELSSGQLVTRVRTTERSFVARASRCQVAIPANGETRAGCAVRRSTPASPPEPLMVIAITAMMHVCLIISKHCNPCEDCIWSRKGTRADFAETSTIRTGVSVALIHARRFPLALLLSSAATLYA